MNNNYRITLDLINVSTDDLNRVRTRMENITASLATVPNLDVVMVIEKLEEVQDEPQAEVN